MPARCFYQNEHGIAYLNTGVAGQNIFIFIKVPRFGCAARIPLWLGPRGEHKGKGARYDAAAEYSVANPSQHLRCGRLPFGEREKY